VASATARTDSSESARLEDADASVMMKTLSCLLVFAPCRNSVA